MPVISPEMLTSLIPETGLIILAFLLLVLVLVKKEHFYIHLDWITAAGFALIAILAFIFGRPDGEPQLLWGEMIRVDRAGYLLSLFVLVGGALTAVFAGTDVTVGKRPEFYLLLTLASIGLVLMGTSANLIMLYLAIETSAIPLYVLAGIKYREEWSVESGIKYFLFGGFSSAIMLFGFSLLYGFAGTTKIYGLKDALEASGTPQPAIILAAIFVLAGFTFKISAVPFHFWAPDVYQGSPTPVAGFLSTVSKAAGFIALIRVLVNALGVESSNVWMILIAVISVASMFLGNLLAIPQKNLKRMIAYSSIAQAGYILVGVASGTEFGFTGAVYYLMAYLVTNLAVFAIINWIEYETGSTEISAFAGLNRREPGLAFLLMVTLLSLGGIPPLAGFFAKVLVFGAAIQSGMAWLAVLAIINSVIALYYYLKVMKVMYVDQPLISAKVDKLPLVWSLALIVCIMGIVVLGVVYTPWYNFISLAAAGF
jgi:NADH-quinone oxidoreductase subunit N